MNKAIFWDFDGTLAKAPFLWSGSIHQAVRSVVPGCDIALNEIRQYTKAGFTWDTPDEDYSKLLGDKWWEHMLTFFSGIYEKLGVPEQYRAKASSLTMENVKDIKRYELFEDTSSALNIAAEKGYSNYILSNHIPELESIVKQLGIASYFNGYIISSLVGYDKPRPEIFEYAKTIAGHPDLCYMIGDNPVADMIGGKAADMKTILVHKDITSSADLTCDNLIQAVNLLA